MTVFIKKILFPILLFIAVFVTILHCVNNRKEIEKNVEYTLKSYKNTIALYSGDDIVEIYNNIVLNTLPEADIQSFNKGVSISSPAQAEIFLENYDG